MMAAHRHEGLMKRNWRRLRHLAYASPLYGLALGGRAPTEIRGTPPEVWPGDEAAGRAILDGTFTVDGGTVETGDAAWREGGVELQGFDWLSHLKAVANDEARRRARKLTAAWIDAHQRWSLPAWRVDVIGTRLANWFSHYGALIQGAEEGFERNLLTSAARQARHLARTAASEAENWRTFRAVKGMVYAGVCLPGREHDLDLGLRLLERALARQILPDGGHVTRNPAVLLAVLRTLVALRATLIVAHVEVPSDLQGAIDRMAPMVRCLRHGDGRLALFNGGGEVEETDIARVLAQTGSRGKALLSAPHSGFHRMACGRTLIIADTGAPPPPGADADAAAGTLGFEMSVGRQRFVVNCGAARDPKWRAALRSSAAHSTVIVDDVNSSEVLSPEGLGRRPDHVFATRREAHGNLLIEASHDGYAHLFGLLHRRLIHMTPDGSEVLGEDILSGRPAAGEGRARFHLHPAIQASVLGDGATVILKPPRGKAWHFKAQGARVSITESVYVANPGDIRRTQQIVAAWPLGDDATTIKWRLRRHDTDS
ncbi:MAG: heparinase II/III family protein [Rhodospirillales bacterium]|jgi:uncharacterized heparinase superfamily protein|nr:heparinase II/III family protein [Rhodospirillales bacterium]HJO96468.1 heparinase II/III family protein [Rhodospirillales bacterium]